MNTHLFSPANLTVFRENHLLFFLKPYIIVNAFRGVAQVVERYFREVEAASSSLVIPIEKKPRKYKGFLGFFMLEN